MSEVPYIGFGNDTLARQPDLKAGDLVDCPICKGKHEVFDSKPPMMLFFRCGDTSYLAGMKGKSTMHVPSDCSGKVDV